MICSNLKKSSFSDRRPAASGRLSYLLVAVVGLIGFGLMLAGSADAQNLLTNGNFNTPNSTAAPAGWTIWTYANTAGDAWANHAKDSYSYDGRSQALASIVWPFNEGRNQPNGQ